MQTLAVQEGAVDMGATVVDGVGVGGGVEPLKITSDVGGKYTGVVEVGATVVRFGKTCLVNIRGELVA